MTPITHNSITLHITDEMRALHYIENNFTLDEKTILHYLEQEIWPELTNFECRFMNQRVSPGFNSDSYKLRLQNDEIISRLMTRYNIVSPTPLTLWRGTRSRDDTNKLMSTSLCKNLAENFKELDLIKIEIPAGTPIFPTVVYQMEFKGEGEILLRREDVLKYGSRCNNLKLEV